MFHENLFRYSPEAVLSILKGPISSDAPYATDEQPGPNHMYIHIYIYIHINLLLIYKFTENKNINKTKIIGMHLILAMS